MAALGQTPPHTATQPPKRQIANQEEEDSRFSPEERRQWMLRSLQDYEPDLKGRPERLDAYVARFREKSILNHKAMPFDVKAQISASGRGVTLSGEVLYEEHKLGLQQVLERLGFSPIENNIAVLPDAAGLGDKAFAIATTATLSLWREPRRRSEQVNQVLLGAPLRLLKKDDSGQFYFVQSHDDYVGWVEAAGVLAVDKAQWLLWRQHYPRARLIRSLPLQSYLPITHPLHAMTAWEGTILPIKKNGLDDQLVLPGGERIALARLKEGVDYALVPAPDVEAWRARLLALAEPYLDVKYQWGGITPAGFDCSGFTRHIYRQLGVQLARDADQQAVAGELAAFRGYREGLLPGDLIFFIGRRGSVSHVALSLGGMDYVHSAGRGVHLGSFEPESPYYNKGYDEKFAFAKRIFPLGLPR
ncbi:MAG: C40 family peptidase [Candidatus Sumerlaeia bacterium]